MLTVSTTPPVVTLNHRIHFLYALWVPFLAFLPLTSRSKHQQRRIIFLAIPLLVSLLIAGCGGGGLQGNNGGSGGTPQPGTTPGTYLIKITATCGTDSQPATVTLKVQ